MQEYSSTSNSRWRTALTVVLLSGVLVFLIWHQNALFQGLTRVTLSGLAIVLAVKVLATLLNAAKFLASTRLFGLRLSINEALGLSLVTIFFGYIPPIRLGHIPRAYYLKQVHALDYFRYVSLLTAVNILEITITSLVGLAVIFWKPIILSTGGFDLRTPLIIAISGALVGIACLFLVVRSPLTSRLPRLRSFANKLGEGLILMLRSPELSLCLLGLSLASLLVVSFGLQASMWAIGVNLGFPEAVLATVLANLTLFVSVTPGNLGVTEGVLLSALYLMGIPIEQGLPGVILSRIANLIIHLPFGALYSLIFFGKLTVKPYSKQQ